MPAFFTFCPICGARLTTGPIHGREREHCPACGFIHYRNPAPVGMALVQREGRLLLIRRAIPPLQGYWAPPAGHVEVGESVPEAAAREAREEAGVQVALRRLVGVYSQADVEVIIMAYAGEVIGGELRAGEDAGEAALFGPGELPTQPFPAQGTALDRWFYGVLQDLTAGWQEPAA
ncbi:MAG: NUDIX hydrolase [Chloroflexi bacterium]|nr:NUDIX hydrolase [Chloroflexota bacterium]